MKIANTADWHIRGKDLDACRSQLLAMHIECVERRVDLVTVAGDVFHSSTIGDQYASTGAQVEVALEVVRLFSQSEIQVLMIPGNHDKAGAGSVDALHVFDGLEDVEVVREVKAHNVWFKGGRCLRVLCLPWAWSGNAEEILGTLAGFEGEADLLLGHAQVAGARMQGAFTCDAKPGAWQLSRAFLNTLPVRRIALGDFHARQELVEGKGGYIGALRQLTFGEEGNPAGFEIWDTETGAVEWVELGAAPVHRTTILRPGDPFDVVMDSSVKQRVRFEGKIPSAETVHKLEGLGVQVETIVPVQERVRRANVPDGIINDPHALIGLWAEHQEPRIEGDRLARMLTVYDSLQADARREEKAA